MKETEAFSLRSLGTDQYKTLYCSACHLTLCLAEGDDYYTGDQGSEICIVCYHKVDKVIEGLIKEKKMCNNITLEASAVLKSREATYGPPKENFTRIARLWNSYINGAHGTKSLQLNPSDVGYMMILLKIARLQKTPDHHDSLVDIVGYAQCIEKMEGESNESLRPLFR